MRAEFIKQLSDTIKPVLPFLERENLMTKGLFRYLDCVVGEYLTPEQIRVLVKMLQDLRYRPAEVNFSGDLCEVVSEDTHIRNRFIPRKTLRKDHMAVVLYNLSPYALLSRQATAAMAKCAFPNFFSNVSTINSTFTKYVNLGTDTAQSQVLIKNFPVHNTDDIENLLITLGIEATNSQ